MKSITELENLLEEEKDHSAFLEKLLRILYGDGWENLTFLDAKNCTVVRPPNNPVEPTKDKKPIRYGDKYHTQKSPLHGHR